jgi:maleate isomerase
MLNELPKEVEKLRDAAVKAIAFTCTTGSLYGGKGYNEQIERQIKEIARVPATSTSSAVIEALRCLDARKIVVLTPYSKEVNEMEKRFLELHGLTVRSIRTLDTRGLRHSDIEEGLLFNQAKELGDTDSDAVFLSCTGLPTVTVLKKIENAVGKPVISSNQATMWRLKNIVGLFDAIQGFGSLLEQPAA